MFVKFQHSGSNSFLDMRGPKCTVVFAASFTRPWREKSYPERVYDPALLCVKFQLSSSNSFGDMMGPKFTLGGAAPLTRP